MFATLGMPKLSKFGCKFGTIWSDHVGEEWATESIGLAIARSISRGKVTWSHASWMDVSIGIAPSGSLCKCRAPNLEKRQMILRSQMRLWMMKPDDRRTHSVQLSGHKYDRKRLVRSATRSVYQPSGQDIMPWEFLPVSRYRNRVQTWKVL